MNNKNTVLLEYIKTLYDRKNSKASKDGMTYWAILAGLIYVTWHLLKTVSELPSDTTSYLDFYHAFSQTHLALLSLSYFISVSSSTNKKNDLDHRILRSDVGTAEIVVVLLIILGPPLYCIHEIIESNAHIPYFYYQTSINFWALSAFLTLYFIFVPYHYLKFSKNDLPPAAELCSRNSKSFEIFSIMMRVLVFEILTGNILNIVIDIYGSKITPVVYDVAFNTSLIIFGLLFLFNQKGTYKDLDRLASLERDAIIHELSDKEIMERLQDEYLGRYVGDWISELLKEIRGIGESLCDHSIQVDKLIAEVDSINATYSRERIGRIEDYLDELEEKNTHHQNSLDPLLKWLEEAKTQASMNNDSFMLSLVKSSYKELESSNKEVHSQVNEATTKLKEWLKNHTQ